MLISKTNQRSDGVIVLIIESTKHCQTLDPGSGNADNIVADSVFCVKFLRISRSERSELWRQVKWAFNSKQKGWTLHAWLKLKVKCMTTGRINQNKNKYWQRYEVLIAFELVDDLTHSVSYAWSWITRSMQQFIIIANLPTSATFLHMLQIQHTHVVYSCYIKNVS